MINIHFKDVYIQYMHFRTVFKEYNLFVLSILNTYTYMYSWIIWKKTITQRPFI